MKIRRREVSSKVLMDRHALVILAADRERLEERSYCIEVFVRLFGKPTGPGFLEPLGFSYISCVI